MKNIPLVSILTPCYNGEKFVDRFLNSILNQTYKNIELIFINDGSTDNTEKIVLSYYSKFKKKHYQLIYLKQENSGQAAAINKGLEVLSGDYIIWPDSDDWLSYDSIEKRVKFLENNKEYGFVRSNGFLCYFQNNILHKKEIISKNKNRFKENIFDDLVNETTYCYCGCYMIRKEVLINTNPGKKILENRGGQNWQIEIPIAYNYSCGFLDEPLYYISVRNNSHSRKKESFVQQIKRQDDLFEIMLWSLKIAKCLELEKYKKIAYSKMMKNKMIISFHYFQKEYIKDFYNQLKSIGANDIKCKVIYIITRWPFLNKFIENRYKQIKKQRYIKKF